MGTQPSYKLPFTVKINADNIGGPSAGLAFTLAIIDSLSGGELTGGRIVAATGTIDPDGSVGDVGGVAQKTVAVERAGATLFLVPDQELAVARSKATSSLTVLGVSSLQQALDDLARHGGKLGAAAVGAAGGRRRPQRADRLAGLTVVMSVMGRKRGARPIQPGPVVRRRLSAMPDDRRLTVLTSARTSPDDVARHTFATARRGFDPAEVRAYLETGGPRPATRRPIVRSNCATPLAEAEQRAANPVLDETTLTNALGQETARVLRSAQDAAAELVARAEAETAHLRSPGARRVGAGAGPGRPERDRPRRPGRERRQPSCAAGPRRRPTPESRMRGSRPRPS